LRLFNCKSFYFCPPQKWTLLFSAYVNQRLLLELPHRQFIKLLRSYLRFASIFAFFAIDNPIAVE
jgi:hypothetical protein